MTPPDIAPNRWRDAGLNEPVSAVGERKLRATLDRLLVAGQRRGAAMRVLVACEFSGIVRDAFIAAGHDAVSCDLLPSERPGPHVQGDVRELLGDGWDLMVAFPPCTHLAVSGAKWFKFKRDLQAEALDFVRLLMGAPIPRIAVENPVSVISSQIRKPDQIVQPWMFGDGVQKTTCLWLTNLPRLVPTDIVKGREQKVWREPPSPDRWKIRSRTYLGFARAMATQWGDAAAGTRPNPSSADSAVGPRDGRRPAPALDHRAVDGGQSAVLARTPSRPRPCLLVPARG